MVRNYFVLTGMILTILALIPLVSYILPKQWAEVKRPKSPLTPARISLFLLELSITLTMIPGIPRSYQTLIIPAVNDYAKAVSITNRLPYVFISVILVILYRERLD